MGVIFQLSLHEHTVDANLVDAIGSQEMLLITIMNQWPVSGSPIPAEVPTNIAKFYEQGLRALKFDHWDAAGAMFRKTLDVATKQLRSDLSKKTLYARIEEMVSAGDLTQAMGQWSHRVRLDGNEAVHGEEPETEADARTTQQFAEAFLTYSFTLPALVREGQEAAEAVDS